MSDKDQLTLIVDEIPGLIVGNLDEPPGRIMIVDGRGQVIWEIATLKMPYDVAQTPDGNYLVNIIRARAVWEVALNGVKIRERRIGGYPCGLDSLPDDHILVAGWDDHVPGFVREFDAAGKIIWGLENLYWPWKAQRLPNGNTLVCAGVIGNLFEVTPAGETVWQYVNPMVRGGILAQGELPGKDVRGHLFNAVFKVHRYAPDYPGLRGRDLTPKGTITERAAQGLDLYKRRPQGQGGGGDRRGGQGGRSGGRGGNRDDRPPRDDQREK